MTDTKPRPSEAPGLDGPLSDALVGTRRFFTKGEVSADHRSLYEEGAAATGSTGTAGPTTTWSARRSG